MTAKPDAVEDVVPEDRRCQHGAVLGSAPNWDSGWCGGVSRCGCCFRTFGYIDSFSVGSTGDKTESWQPKDRCGSCGGRYIRYAYGDQK